jgi:hypothetical protein
MSTLTDTGYGTLADLAAVIGPDSKEAKITNVLTKKNPFLDVLPWMEGNLATGHQIKQTATHLAQASWRQINRGVTNDKTDVNTFTETCGRLEREIPIDEALVELNGGSAYMMKETRMGIEGIGQQLMTALLYESPLDNPERILGLTPRFPATSGFDTSGQVKAGTNAGTNAHSLWILTPGEHLHGIFPKGTKAGLEVIDRGVQRFADAQSPAKYFYGPAQSLVWRVGLVVDDYRYLVRIQWDPDDAAMADVEMGLINLLDDGLADLYEVTPATRILANRTTFKKLNKQMKNAPGNDHLVWQKENKKLLGPGELGAVFTAEYANIPLIISDSLVAETAIS